VVMGLGADTVGPRIVESWSAEEDDISAAAAAKNGSGQRELEAAAPTRVLRRRPARSDTKLERVV
jgi:hypothetical protein